MERQNRLITILALVFLGLVAIAYFGEEPAQRADDDSPAERPVLAWKADDVTGLKLVDASRAVTFVKTDGSWRMTGPKDAPIEERKVTEVIDKMIALTVEEREIAGSLADFGLDEAARVEMVLTRGDGSVWTLFVGRDAPVGYRSYVAENVNGPVLLASTRVGEYAHRGVDDFRSKDVWKVSTFSAHRVRIEDAGVTTVLRKDDHGWWLGDEGGRADDDAVRDWLSKASLLRAEAFLDDADPATLGLGAPAATIQIEDDKGTHELKLGSRDAAGVTALGEGTPPLRLGPDALELVRTAGWASAKLIPVHRFQIDRVEFQLGEVRGTWMKEEGKWKRDGGGDAELDALFDALESAAAD